MMDIQRYIKEAHENAVDKGFYTCPKCSGTGYLSAAYEKDREVCGVCNKTGIDPNKNIGELLMLIVSELGEALEAHRCGRFADMKWYYAFIDALQRPDYGAVESIYKNIFGPSFEFEIADVFIRLFDLCGYLGHEIGDNLIPQTHQFSGNIGQFFFCRVITALGRIEIEKADHVFETDTFRYVMEIILGMCESMNIPIEKHIEAKMAYNKTRPPKHGKRY